MTIGTSLFHQASLRDLSGQSGRIAELQGQIASGKNDPRPSADPVRALRLSAAQEHHEALSRFATNIDRAQARLDQSDTILAEGVEILRRVSELAIKANSDTMTGAARESIAMEARELRDSLLGIANARDNAGQPLFGGYLTGSDPFVDGPEGITYRGDAGQARLPISESMSLPTALSGAEVFQMGDIPEVGIFAIINDFITQLNSSQANAKAQVTAEDTLRLAPEPGAGDAGSTIRLGGPQGSAMIDLPSLAGDPAGAVAAINARTAETGVSAVAEPDGSGLVLTASGEIALGDLDGATMLAEGADTPSTLLVPPAKTRDGVLERLTGATDHLIDQRTRLGALSASAARQGDVIESRALATEQSLSNLGDLDLADALTRLQQSMLNRDATLQAYVKISKSNLFDYLR